MAPEKVVLLDFVQSEGETCPGELASAYSLPGDFVGLGQIGTDYADSGRDFGKEFLDLGRVFRKDQATASLHEVLDCDILVGMSFDRNLLFPSVDCEGSLCQLQPSGYRARQ